MPESPTDALRQLVPDKITGGQTIGLGLATPYTWDILQDAIAIGWNACRQATLDVIERKSTLSAIRDEFVSELGPPVQVVGTDRWDDQYRPTVARPASAREAALAILTQMEWDEVGDMFEDDPIVFYGTVAWIADVVKLSGEENTLVAWLTSRMRVVRMCMTDGHEDDDGTRWFNDCWAGDPDSSPCVWGSWWTVDADPREFWEFAQTIARTGR